MFRYSSQITLYNVGELVELVPSDRDDKWLKLVNDIMTSNGG